MFDQNTEWVVDEAERQLNCRIAEKETVEYWKTRALKAEAEANKLRTELGQLKDEKYTILPTRED